MKTVTLMTAVMLAGAAPTAAASSEPPVLDAALRLAVARPSGDKTFLPGATRGGPDSRWPVLVQFAHPPSPNELEALERAGIVEWRRHAGAVMGTSTVLLGRLAPDAAPRLASRPGVERVELDWRLGGRPPLDVTGPLSRVDAVWPQLDADGLPLTGAGVVIADLDSGVDPTHPALFRADAEPLVWHDDDGGGFDGAGGEWVDLDGNDSRGPGETLRFIGARTSASYPPGNPAGFTPGLDWLYADVDGDGRRDTAPADGWDESSPSLGEPVFLADDLDGDGVLDPDEPLHRLGASKVRAVRTPDGTVHRRGESLLEVPVDAWAHGTPVCNILAGGEPGLSRLTGFAPGAEIVMATIEWSAEPRFWTTLPELALWAADEGARVLLIEDGEWVWEFMDGTSAGEVLLSELARDQGIVVLSAAGNLAGGGQHDRRTAAAGSEATFELRDAPDTYPIHVLWLNLNWRGGRDGISWRVEGPVGTFSGEVPDEITRFDFPGGAMDLVADTSPGGTQMVAFRVEAASGLPSGTWSFTLATSGDRPVTVDAFKWDDLSGWSGNTYFLDASDEGSVTWPATAANVIVVAAYSGRPGFSTPQGELNSFSGRGVALDGRRLVDLAAPGSTTFSAAESRQLGVLGPWGSFGGTSAALPHVAGTAALLLQAVPEATPAQVERALQRGAVADGDTGAVPSPNWGYGKLDAAAALDALRLIVEEEHTVTGETPPPRRARGRLP